MTYTKGPLRIAGPSQGGGPYDDGGDYAIIEPGGIIIGEANYRISESGYRDAEANARLWAAAPDLLRACELAIQDILCFLDGTWDGNEDGWAATVFQMSKAVNKAIGGES